MDELDALDTVRLGIALLSLALMVLFTGRRLYARKRARRARPVRATVVAVARRPGSRMHRCFVDTTFEVPGHGELVHCRGFQTEGRALLWARLHKQGSAHWVVPDEVHRGCAFLREDLERFDWLGLVVAALMAVFMAYPVYRLAVEYWPS